jgi:hypothetical protein
MHYLNPHYVNTHQSDLRAIKDGWYAMDDDGNLVSGPFFQSQGVRRENHPANKWINAVRFVLTAKPTSVSDQ